MDSSLTTDNTKTPFSEREKEILKKLGDGKTNKEISKELGISAATVRNQLSTLFIKLNSKNRAQAVIAAIKLGVIKL